MAGVGVGSDHQERIAGGIQVGCRPRPVVALPWGSESMTRTLRSLAAREAARLMAVVVFPTPPFWLAMAKTLLKRQ